MTVSVKIYFAISLLTVTMTFFIGSNQAFAVTDRGVKLKQETVRQKVAISKNGLNRINFGSSAVREVIGDKNKYQLLKDTGSRNIFILPKGDVGEKFDVTFIDTSGRATDVEFVVIEKTAMSYTMGVESNNFELIVDEERTLALKMLKAMRLGIKGQFYVYKTEYELINKVLSKLLPTIKILDAKTYKYGEMTGLVFEIKNNGKLPFKPSAIDFEQMFSGTMLTGIELTEASSIIQPKAKGYVYLITKNIKD